MLMGNASLRKEVELLPRAELHVSSVCLTMPEGGLLTVVPSSQEFVVIPYGNVGKGQLLVSPINSTPDRNWVSSKRMI
jgi:hypothetical protein